MAFLKLACYHERWQRVSLRVLLGWSRFEAERNQSNFKLGNRGFQGVDFAMTQKKGEE